MGEWTWLHAKFPSADIALTQPPLPPKVANVLVRTIRLVDAEGGENRYQLRVAPHNVAPFRGGPWTRVFLERDLLYPGAEMDDFREKLTAAIEQVYSVER